MKYPYLSLFFILSLAIEVASVRAELQLSCYIDQITDTASDVRAIRPLSINANGTRIAFISNGDFTGLNKARNFVPFLFDTRTGFGQIGLISQATLGQLLPTYVSMDAAGTRIAYVIAGNFVRPTLFLDDLSQRMTIPIVLPRSADSPFGIQQPSISANGTRIAFVSDDDLETGGNADHNRE